MRVRRGILVFLALALFAVAISAQIPGESWVRIGLLAGNVSAAGVSPAYDSDKTLFAGLQGSGLSVSTNNGRNWTHLSSIPNSATITGIAFYPTYEYGRGKPVFVATREGHIYESETDFTSIKYDYTVKDRSGAVKPVTCVVFEPVHNYVYAGSQGGGVFRSINYGQTWTRVNSVDWDDCRALAVQRSTGKLLGAFYNSKYAPVAGYLGSGEWQWLGPSSLPGAVPTALHVAVDKDSVVFLGTLTHGLWVSQDVGGSWSAACDGSTQTQTFSVGAVAACPSFSNDHEVWDGRSDGLRLSFDGGATCAPDFPYSSVQFIAFSPGYHRGGACDAFVGTNTGLYLRTCNPGPPPEPVTPPAVTVSTVAIGPREPGVWAVDGGGLLRNTIGHVQLQYNASGAFNNTTPNIAAICLDPVFDASKTSECGNDAQTLFVAEKTLGVFKSTDNGNSWTKVDYNSTWPAGVMVNDLAISPKYANGGPDYTLFAATTNGVWRWGGPNTGWVQTGDGFTADVTHVAVPPTYNPNGGTGVPYDTVFCSSDTYTDPKTGLPVGLLFSNNNGTRWEGFSNVADWDITAIDFSPTFYGSDFTAVYSSATRGVIFARFDSSNPYTADACWCQITKNLGSLNVRDLLAAPSPTVVGFIRLVAATAVGPYYMDLDPSAPSDPSRCPDVAGSFSWQAGLFPNGGPASGCADTLCLNTGRDTSGAFTKWLALGTAEDGVVVSSDQGKNFRYWETGYRSLPDDVYNIIPHMRSENILFATSPNYGVFVSTDKGDSFRPWNRGSSSSGTSPCTVNSAYGIAMMADRRGPALPGWDIVWAGANDAGIKYRWIRWDSATNIISLDGYAWTDSTVSSGRFERFSTLGWGQQAPAHATSPTLGFYTTLKTNWSTWYADNLGLPDLTSKSVVNGYESPDPEPITSGQTVTGGVQQGNWDYYTLNVPAGTQNFHTYLTSYGSAPANDPDLYIKYGTKPTTSSYDFASVTTGNEEICVRGLPHTLLSEDFEGTWGPYGNVPPAGWTVPFTGSESPNVWNMNDWYKYNYGGTYGNMARVSYTPQETSQYEGLETPAIASIPATATSLTIEFDQRFYPRGGGDMGYIYYTSDRHTGWTMLYSHNTLPPSGLFEHTVVDVGAHIADFAGDTNVRFLFYYYMNPTNATYGYWEIDNVKVADLELATGNWYIGVRGNGTGTNAYDLTATLDGCPAGMAQGPAPVSEAQVKAKAWNPKATTKAQAQTDNSLPGPLAPTAGSIWGTVSNTGGGGGVWRGTDSTAIVASPVPVPTAVTWEQRNGTGAGALTNLTTQCVLELPDLTLIEGSQGDVAYSPAPDEGRTTWVTLPHDIAHVAGACNFNFTDLLYCSNGDALIAANGNSDGGVWLSGDKGRHWMKISSGFDSSSRRLEDLARDNLSGNVSYYASTDSTGLYRRAITAPPYPTVTGLSSSSGPTTGGAIITVTGTGFSNACPTGSASDCPTASPVVLFGETEAASTTFQSSTSLQCAVPAHGQGPALVTVRNPDTRQGGSQVYSYNCTAPTGLVNNTAADVDCGDTGVLVTWTSPPSDWADGGSGTRTFDVIRGATTIASGLAEGTTTYTDTTGANGTSYTYKVLYRNGCGLTATTAGVAAADYVTPGAPAITSITDQDACAQSGIHVYFTLGSGATQHALLRDGVQVVANYKSGDPYNPGSTASYTYTVRAMAGSTCHTDSTGSAFADANGTPGAPVISAVTDNDPYAQDGVRVAFTGGSGALSHQLYKDGAKVVDPYVSGALYNPGDTSAHTYVVRAVNGSCVTDSTGMSGTDQFLVPLEVPNASLVWASTGKNALSWSAATGATGYRVYRAGDDELRNIPSSAKVCVSYNGAETSTGAILTREPAAGHFFWYLAVAYNGAGEGSAGANRTLSSTGNCSTP